MQSEKRKSQTYSQKNRKQVENVMGVIHIVCTHEGGGEGLAKKRMFAYEGVLLGQVRTHAKKKFALFQVFDIWIFDILVRTYYVNDPMGYFI